MTILAVSLTTAAIVLLCCPPAQILSLDYYRRKVQKVPGLCRDLFPPSSLDIFLLLSCTGHGRLVDCPLGSDHSHGARGRVPVQPPGNGGYSLVGPIAL